MLSNPIQFWPPLMYVLCIYHPKPNPSQTPLLTFSTSSLFHLNMCAIYRHQSSCVIRIHTHTFAGVSCWLRVQIKEWKKKNGKWNEQQQTKDRERENCFVLVYLCRLSDQARNAICRIYGTLENSYMYYVCIYSSWLKYHNFIVCITLHS